MLRIMGSDTGRVSGPSAQFLLSFFWISIRSTGEGGLSRDIASAFYIGYSV